LTNFIENSGFHGDSFQRTTHNRKGNHRGCPYYKNLS